MLTRLKEFLFNSKLRRFKTTNLEHVRSGHFDNLQSIGIVFYAAEQKSIEHVMRFRDRLKAKGVDVDALGYFDSKEEPGPQVFSYFTDAGLTFALTPSSDVALQFIEHPYDILINLDHSHHKPLTYITAASKALFKVGPASGDPKHFDLMVDVGPQYSVPGLITEIRRTFKVINS